MWKAGVLPMHGGRGRGKVEDKIPLSFPIKMNWNVPRHHADLFFLNNYITKMYENLLWMLLSLCHSQASKRFSCSFQYHRFMFPRCVLIDDWSQAWTTSDPSLKWKNCSELKSPWISQIPWHIISLWRCSSCHPLKHFASQFPRMFVCFVTAFIWGPLSVYVWIVG